MGSSTITTTSAAVPVVCYLCVLCRSSVRDGDATAVLLYFAIFISQPGAAVVAAAAVYRTNDDGLLFVVARAVCEPSWEHA